MTEVKKEIKITENHGKKITKTSSTIVTKCDCINEYMDKIYGKGMRVKNSYNSGYRCTVCGK